MQYMNVKEASSRWGISERRIRILCSEGRVEGVQRAGWSWNIPVDTPKPGDGRTLRHLKNFEMRIGSQNFSLLDDYRERFESAASGVPAEVLAVGVDRLCESLCLCTLEDEQVPISAAQLKTIYGGALSVDLPLSSHLLALNCRSAFRKMFRDTRFGEACKGSSACHDTPSVEAVRAGRSFWSEQALKDLNRSLLHALDDEQAGRYRDAEIPAGGAWGGDQRTFPVFQQMETLFVQYDREWSMLHPLVRAVFMFGELLRIRPFPNYSVATAWFALSGELMAGGYPPAVLDDGRLAEFRATLALTQRRGNYQGTARMVEESVRHELDSLIRLCQS